ncbi:MAG: dimethyl sulfoxide reductase anchor subunit [Alphaproteobacteria bacterium]|nr:dimethyl sulfoxide reductase anchor subunit [Alphaproteobacteria bacterium]
MHPAYSVIFFTTASGAGYGLLAMLGTFAAFGLVPPDPWFGAVAFALALGAIAFGLVSSTFHLGHPERAWRAYSQWRTSWLSREGVAATLTFVPAGLFAFGWMFVGENGGIWGALGLVVAAAAAATVYCTAMIYAALKTIRAWNHGIVTRLYLALAVLTGSLWYNALAWLFGHVSPFAPLVVIIALSYGFWLKRRYWMYIDGTHAASTVATATGLAGLGPVRLLDAPNTQENFVQEEMGYRIARAHATKLRRYAFFLLFAIPAALVLIGMEASLWLGLPCAVLAALSASFGVVIERWLFFAEAKHVVTLYYGADAA